MSAHIRHLARELLLSAFRFARGKSYRAKGKFVNKPEFFIAYDFFKAWSEASSEGAELVAYWDNYIKLKDLKPDESEPLKPTTPNRRRRRRPRRRARAAAPFSDDSST
jgi:hypothetical protein